MKKISLLSLMSVCMIAPAIAEPSHTSATFPNDELMQEDYTYTGQATYTNTGVYSGNVDADPEFAWTDITVNAGYYLPGGEISVYQCMSTDYCPGLQNPVHYEQLQDQGNFYCGGLGDHTFTASDPGSTSDTQCYRSCDVANMGTNGTITEIAHATALSGRDYYGTGVDTCIPTACEPGYSVNNGVCIANTINITWNGATAEDIVANEAGTCTYSGDIRTPRAFSGTVPTGKHFVGWKFVKPQSVSTAFDLANVQVDTVAMENGDVDITYLDNRNKWSVPVIGGTLRGDALCSSTNGTRYTTGNPDLTSPGVYCWCRVTGYQANSSENWQDVTPSDWALISSYADIADCTDYCWNDCGFNPYSNNPVLLGR